MDFHHIAPPCTGSPRPIVGAHLFACSVTHVLISLSSQTVPPCTEEPRQIVVSHMFTCFLAQNVSDRFFRRYHMFGLHTFPCFPCSNRGEHRAQDSRDKSLVCLGTTETDSCLAFMKMFNKSSFYLICGIPISQVSISLIFLIVCRGSFSMRTGATSKCILYFLILNCCTAVTE